MSYFDSNHLIVDLETLGIEPGCVILSIGAIFISKDELLKCLVNNTKLPISSSKFITLSIKESIDNGFTVDSKTVNWWLEQSDKIRIDNWSGIGNIVDSINKFNNWILLNTSNNIKTYYWDTNNFDFSILEEYYKYYNIDIPWKFWEKRDLRTLNHSGILSSEVLAKYRNNHDAQKDAYNEFRLLIESFKKLYNIHE